MLLWFFKPLVTLLFNSLLAPSASSFFFFSLKLFINKRLLIAVQPAIGKGRWNMALKRGQYGGRGLRNEWDEALQRGTLVRRTASEETAGCQLDDCSCLPRELLMARQRHSLYGSRARLTPLLSASPFSGFQPLTEDKSIWLLLKCGRVEYWLCVYRLSFYFIIIFF